MGFVQHERNEKLIIKRIEKNYYERNNALEDSLYIGFLIFLLRTANEQTDRRTHVTCSQHDLFIELYNQFYVLDAFRWDRTQLEKLLDYYSLESSPGAMV